MSGSDPDALAREMFAIARTIREAAGHEDGATVIVRPDVIAAIATGVGRLAQERPRADAAYAEGVRQTTRAAAAAAREGGPAHALLRRFVEWASNATRTEEELEELVVAAERLLKTEATE